MLTAIMIIIGLFNMIWPRSAWELARGWEFKDAEPSDEALYVTRVGGGLLILCAITRLF